MKLEEVLQITKEQKTFLILLMTLKLTKSEMRCSKCRRKMNLQKREREPLGHIFRCPYCRTSKTIVKGTVFEKLKFSPKSFFLLLYFFYYQIDNCNFLKLQTDITTDDTLGFYRKLLRNCLLETYVRFFSEQVGGSDHQVHIDEIVLGKRKYHKGKLLKK